MKKRGILAIIISLLLTISTIVVLSASNSPPTIFLNSPSNNIGTITKSYTGSGNQLNAILYITNNYNNAPNASNTASNIYIPCPSGWKIIWTNLTLSNINAPNTTIESNYTTTNASLDLNPSILYAMSFQLTNNAYLDSISAQLSAANPLPTSNFYVYNAENNGGKPRPLNQIASNTNITVPLGTNWVNVSFGHRFLNTSETYDNTFFIAIEKNADLSPKIPQWNATQEASPPANGYVYYYNGLNWLENQSYDCQLIVNVSASTAPAESAKPSEIGLTINGTPVSGNNKGSGEWINSTTSPVSNGYIFYDVNSTWMKNVSFSYVWNITILRDAYASALTNFDISYNGDASWNITVDATGAFPLTNGLNHINITGIPSDWGKTSSMAYNGSNWISLDSYTPNTISFPASNGTWIVNCTAPNYVSDLGIMVGTETVYEKATLDENLNINVNFINSITGTANLSIYDSSQLLNYTAINPVNQSSTSFTWNVSSTASPNDTYNVTIFFESGLEVGYTNRSVEIVLRTSTALIVTSCPSEAISPSLIPVIIYYNDTQNNQGISNASITAWEVPQLLLPIQNLQDLKNGTYKFNVQLPQVYDIHYIYFNASKRLYNSSGTIPIQINYLAPAGWVFTDVNPLFLGLLSNAEQQNQSFTRYLLIGAAFGSVVAVGVVADRVRRKREVPNKALASLENIIVDHVPSGVTIWAFDFLKMEQDAILVSGFMSAVKSFLGEMRKGGLRKLETEFGTFIREDGEVLTATCITSGSAQEEEKWIREKLRSFVSTAELQNWDVLVDWKGEVSSLRLKFLESLASLINLEKAEQLQREKILKVLRERERLQLELNNLGSKLETLNQRLSDGKISQGEFEARRAEIEPKYDRVQMDYIRASILLSKVPYTLEATWETPEAKQELEKIRDKFIEITMKIDALQRKAQGGVITYKEIKRKENLQKELMTLIWKLEKGEKNN